MALTKLTTDLIDGSLGTDWQATPKTADFTAVAGEGYFVDTTSTAITVTLPSSPSIGDEVILLDYAANAGANNITITSSDNIEGATDDIFILTNKGSKELVYSDATKGWLVNSEINTLTDVTVSYITPTGQGFTYTTPAQSTGQSTTLYGPQTFTITDGTNILSGTASISGLPNGITYTQSYNNNAGGNILTITLGGTFPYSDSIDTALTISGLTSVSSDIIVDYLVVAGGGGGGGVGGGGGAGGYRTSYGDASVSALTINQGVSYTVTVGGGGSANATVVNANNDGNIGGNGVDSVFSTITSAGGGGGAGGGNAAGSGGSGGGTRSGTPGSGNTPSTTPAQGFAGAAAVSNFGGGGGGAAEAGNTDGDTHGGDGKANSITGTSTYYAGGGAGGGGGAVGGLGGGAASGNNHGTPNTGGGGGGGTWTNNASYATQGGGNGGSGIVIIRYPNTNTITIGSGLTGNTVTDGSDKITTFTAGTGTISLS